MKHGLVILLMLLCSYVIQAQEVVASSGGEGKTSSVTLNWTIGEPVIATHSNSNNSLTQGVNQGEVSVTSVFEVQNLSYKITAYPNPVTYYVKLVIETEQIKNLKYHLYDLKGNLLSLGEIEKNETEIQVSGYLPGTYFLRVTEANREIKSFKIIKK